MRVVFQMLTIVLAVSCTPRGGKAKTNSLKVVEEARVALPKSTVVPTAVARKELERRVEKFKNIDPLAMPFAASLFADRKISDEKLEGDVLMTYVNGGGDTWHVIGDTIEIFDTFIEVSGSPAFFESGRLASTTEPEATIRFNPATETFRTIGTGRVTTLFGYN